MNPDPRFCRRLWGALLALILLPALAHAQRYELVWSDEFDTLDRSTWRHWVGTAYNNELQYYTARDTNSYTEDGLLYLWAQSERLGGRDYTSARIESEPRGGHRFGRFEARAKMPSGIGLWPAIWMLPENHSWPREGEIDIMEWRGDLPARTSGAVHFQRNGSHAYTSTTWDMPQGQGTFSDDFHIFAVEWDEKGVRWFVDDRQIFEVEKESLNADPYPFDSKPFYWILNVAVGGDFLPNPPAGSQFRQAMVVDYVRVYQDANQKPVVNMGALPDTVEAGAMLDLSLSATDADGQVDSVTVYVNSVHMAQAAGGVLNYTYTAAVEGCYDVEARAYDNDGAEVVVRHRVVVGAGCTQRSFGAAPARVPGTLPFAHYDYGGQGISYFDTTPDVNTGNALGNTFRPTEGVDVRPKPDAPAAAPLITDIQAGEWLAYTVDVEEAGSYTFTARAATPDAMGRIRVQLGEQTLVRSLIFAQQTPEQPYITETVRDLQLPAGQHTLRVTSLFGGFELDEMTFTRTVDTAAEADGAPAGIAGLTITPNPVRTGARVRFVLAAPSAVTLEVVDLLGKVVATLTDSFLASGPHAFAVDPGTLASGMYLLRLQTPEGQQTRPVIFVE